MKRFRSSWMYRILKEELGQSAIVVAMTVTSMMALAGASVDVGHIYFAYQRLVASTNAAALAGAQMMPDTTTASTYVQEYSSANYTNSAGKSATGLNATPFLQNAQVTTTFHCLTTVSGSLNVPCQTATGASGGYNALKVTQTASVPLWFGGLIGVKQMNIAAVSTAAMRGGTNTPWNIAIILDTTASMANKDSGKQCSGTQISCALKGVQTLLGDLDPCALGATCSSGVDPVDSVSLYVFPPVLTSTAGKDYCSGGSGTPTHEYYMVPTLNSSWTYQIIPFSTDYRASDSASTLNTSANIVKAVGAGSGCTGIQAPGGAGTYYAQAIYTAQSDLVARQNANPSSQNAMIILTDGDATATTSYTGSGLLAIFRSTSDLQPSLAGLLNGILGLNPYSYTYPSAYGECGQAVTAAKAAADAGTKVFTIGYGSPTSGCSSDKTYSASLTTGGGSWGPGHSPCQALAAMASSQSNFYSDDASGCQATTTANQSLTTLTAIFHAITSGLTSPRLIPNSTT